MTTRKHFKALVRERMRHTGERYSVARAHVAGEAPGDAWELRGGLHAETAAYANVLANTGVLAPHTGEPLTEAMVLGVGGGLGAGYILWEFGEHDARVLVLGHRRLWQYPARWAAETAERLGLHADVHETGGAKGGGARSTRCSTAACPRSCGSTRTSSAIATSPPGSTATAAARWSSTAATAATC